MTPIARLLGHAVLTAGMVAPLSAVAASPDVLRIGQQADIANLDPTRINFGTLVFPHLLYNTLIALDADGKVQPQLAKSWTFSPDGRTVTLKLQDNATFHDGRKLTSADVAFSFQYVATPAVGANILQFTKLVEKLETPDDNTVVLHVDGPQAAILDLLDMMYILDSKRPKDVLTNGNGTGPFKLSSYDPGQQATFVRNDNYWGGKPIFRRVEIKILPDAQAAVAQLRAGAVDFLPVVGREATEQLIKAKFKTGISVAEDRVFDVGLNVTAPPFDKPEVRQAVSMAMDRARVANEVAGPGSVVKCLPWPARDTRAAQGLGKSCRFDIAAAKALIDKAGVAGTNVEIMSYGQSVPEIGTQAQIVQSELKQIGLNVKINDVSEAAFIARFRKGQFQMTSHVYGRASRSPAAMLLTAVVFWSQGNPMQLHSDSYAADVKQVTTTTDAPDEVWKRIDQFMLSDNWVLPIASLPTHWASTPKLSGVRFSLDGGPILDRAKLD